MKKNFFVSFAEGSHKKSVRKGTSTAAVAKTDNEVFKMSGFPIGPCTRKLGRHKELKPKKHFLMNKKVKTKEAHWWIGARPLSAIQSIDGQKSTPPPPCASRRVVFSEGRSGQAGSEPHRTAAAA